MLIFDRYLFRHLLIATAIVAMVLAVIIFLTESLRFLELIMNAGASGKSFLILTMLALPRFFEVIMPIALMAGTVFVYNRMTMDSELTVMRALGMPPLNLARPALTLALGATLFLWVMTMWVAPASLAGMQQLRQVIKAQYSTLLFREGVFNPVRPGLMVFVRARGSDGQLHGLMIHDSRPSNKTPVTVLAKRGQIVDTPDGQQVLVFDGSRQDINPKNGALNRLDFERYSIDLPEGSGPVRQRWKEPDERTFIELLRPDPANVRDQENKREFRLEIHRRIVGPLLAPAFTVLALVFLLLGPVERRGQGWRIATCIAVTVVIQGLYLAAFNMSRHSDWGLFLMYMLVFLPLGGGIILLGEPSEPWRRRLLARLRQRFPL